MRIQIGKNIGIQKHAGKVRKKIVSGKNFFLASVYWYYIHHSFYCSNLLKEVKIPLQFLSHLHQNRIMFLLRKYLNSINNQENQVSGVQCTQQFAFGLAGPVESMGTVGPLKQGSYKGQVILKGFFGVFNFFQKTNKNTSHSGRNEFIHLFFGRIHGLTICFRN